MHGDKSQRQRERALARFDAGEVDALIATDVAARGIDVAGVTHVINYDAPGGPRLLRPPGRQHRPRRTNRDGNQLRPRRPGRRGAPDGRRPRPRPRVQRRRGQPRKAIGEPRPRQAEPLKVPPPEADEVKVSPATAAKRWTCDRCGMAVGQIDGTPVPLPESWESGAEGEFCLACRRARAAEEALAATPGRVQHRRPRQSPPGRPDRVRGAHAPRPSPTTRSPGPAAPAPRRSPPRASGWTWARARPRRRPRPRNGPPRTTASRG